MLGKIGAHHGACLQRNVYSCFERRGRGRYALTPTGVAAVAHWPQDALREPEGGAPATG